MNPVDYALTQRALRQVLSDAALILEQISTLEITDVRGELVELRPGQYRQINDVVQRAKGLLSENMRYQAEQMDDHNTPEIPRG